MGVQARKTTIDGFRHLPVIIADLMAIFLSIALAYFLRTLSENILPLVPLSHGLNVYIEKWWIFLVILVSIACYGGYGIVISFWDDLLIISRSIFISFLVTWVVLSLQKETESVSRIVITISYVFMIPVTAVLRYIIKYYLYKVFHFRMESYLLGCNDSREEQIIELLNKEWYSGYEIVGLIDENKPDVFRKCTCFIPFWNADETRIKKVKNFAGRVIFISDISGLSFMNTETKSFLSENLAVITSTNGLLSFHRVLIKRIFDVLFSLFLLILLSPLFLLIMIAIRIESKGPAIFRHSRCGRGLAEFNMLKFRTMHTNAGDIFEEYMRQNPDAQKDWETKNKLKEDPRVTSFGRILRKTSLDELPQLVNVLRGEMSVVGPRPDSIEAISNFFEEYREIYSSAKPGITGLWQVSGRSDIDYTKRVKLDYLYVLNWSLWLDLIIILKTFKAILSGKGAY